MASRPIIPEGYVYPDNVPFLGGREPRVTVGYQSIEATNAYLPDQQQVIAVEIDGEARAYPLILLNNHEIANTEISAYRLPSPFAPFAMPQSYMIGASMVRYTILA